MLKRMEIGGNRYVTLDTEKHNGNIFESVEAWKAEGERRFGPNLNNWKYKCPMCGHVASVQDFKDLGVEDPANTAYEECIGRYTGKGTPQKGDSSGCNWAAYGLLGIPKGGTYIFTGPEKGAHIFEFADEYNQ